MIRWSLECYSRDMLPVWVSFFGYANSSCDTGENGQTAVTLHVLKRGAPKKSKVDGRNEREKVARIGS